MFSSGKAEVGTILPGPGRKSYGEIQPSRILRPKQLYLVEILIRLIDVSAAGGILAHSLTGASEPNCFKVSTHSQ